MSQLPEGWFEYQTETGESYFYDTNSGVTSWERPEPSVPVPAPRAAAPVAAAAGSERPAAAAPGGLLGAIQAGARLKKVETKDSSSPLLAAAPAKAAAPAGGLMGAIAVSC